MISPRAGQGGAWLLAGAVAACLAIVVGLCGFVAVRGLVSLWPQAVTELRLDDGSVVLGEVVAGDRADGVLVLRESERERMGDAYRRIRLDRIAARAQPADALAIGLADGRRLFARGGADRIAALLADVPAPASVEEAVRPNALGPAGRAELFVLRVARFLATAPEASNLAGGVLPSLLGTLTLVLLMSVLVMPLGIAAAVFLHRRTDGFARCARVAIHQLAGVPSIVCGVVGLGLFVHGLGAGIDRLWYAERLPMPTFGGGGLLWAAATLALLTLPVVVVSVEEGLARIPAGLHDGSLALGATRDETLWRLLLPTARPALLTGLILAVSRAAGAVAPLMLVGVVKFAPALPLDGEAPYLHPSRQFMHLGFTLYDAALASPDALRGVPRAYACAGLLLGIVLLLNLSAIVLRNRLRERYRALET